MFLTSFDQLVGKTIKTVYKGDSVSAIATDCGEVIVFYGYEDRDGYGCISVNSSNLDTALIYKLFKVGIVSEEYYLQQLREEFESKQG